MNGGRNMKENSFAGWRKLIRNRNEFFAALLMAFATALSAWCGYQSTRWNGKQSILMGETAAIRTEAAQKVNLAGQEAIIDLNMFEQYYRALIEGRKDTERIIMQRFRREARIAVDAWLATNPLRNPDAPRGPFGMKEYRPKLVEEAAALNRQADRKFTQAREANSKVDKYVLLTVMISSVLFFSGLATHFISPRIQVAALFFAAALFFVAIFILLRMPTA
ncbi:MAG: hypothetical protein H6Q48_5000 [Deltaproteobacteria bacterium]|nr:hypothetical protein [Deltaproteobacteria bacterium]